jgi:hypothetical protein
MMRRWRLAPLLRCFNHWRAEADALRAARAREEGERRLLEVMPGCSARWRRHLSTEGGTRRVQLVRKEGRDVST